MEPLKLSQAIEENIIEIFAWIALFPPTLWQLLVRPLAFVDEMSAGSARTDELRFDARMPPVLFLLVGTVPLSVVVVKTSGDAGSMPAMNDAALVLALTIALFPFVWALCALSAAGTGLGRTAFRAAFGTQCYLFCPAWFFVLLGTVAENLGASGVSAVFMLLFFVSLVGTLIVQWRLFVRMGSRTKGAMYFIIAAFLSSAALYMIYVIARATGQAWLA
jgi:hypothetical protein